MLERTFFAFPSETHVTRTTLFKSNRSQAVRLPKDVAFPEGVREVAVLRDGKRRVIVPANCVWDDFFDAAGIDFPEREQPELRDREPL
jgi:antitoxin VapB